MWNGTYPSVLLKAEMVIGEDGVAKLGFFAPFLMGDALE
jgi:hypothetical protein